MSAFCEAVLTTQGNSLLIEAAAGQKIEFTRLATGSGEYDGTEELRAMEALKEERQSFPFVRYEKVSEESVLLTAVISNEGMTLGYRMTEMGVYGRLEGEEEEVLSSIAITPSQEEADFWPPWNGLAPMEIVQRYYISISPEAVPVIKVDQGSALAEIAAETLRAQSEEGRLGEKIEEEEARAAGEEESLYRFVETGMAGVTEAIEGEARRALQSEAELESRKVDKVEGKQLSSNDYTRIEKDKVHVAYDKSHSHENRSVLETISAELLGKWNSAVEHITDTLKHVTEEEREKWEDVWSKSHSHSNAGVLGKITQAMLDKLNGIAEGANHYAHPTGTGYKHIPSGGSSGQILRWSADGTAQWGNDNNTTYGNMKAATSTAGGGAGLVPAPGAGAQGKYLRGDGTWQTPPNTTYSAGNQMTIENGAIKLKNACTSVEDWNDAKTNGWHMGFGAANAPNNELTWFFGLVIAHNDKYIRQILYRFAGTNGDNDISGTKNNRYERVMYSGTWGNWVDTSVHVAVPANAKFTDTTYNIANNDTTTAAGYIADARIVRTHGSEIDAINNKLTTYYGETGYTDLSLQAALTKYLTYTNIPARESRTFFLHTKEGYYTGNAIAWNRDWICGFVVRGSANINSIDAYYFTRFVSQGADTVLKKLGSGQPILLGTGTSYNIKTLYPTYYAGLTADNFIVAFNSASSTGGTRNPDAALYPQFGNISGSTTLTKSYNSTTGQLTIGGLGIDKYNSSDRDNVMGTYRYFVSTSISIKVYMVI